MTDPREEEMTRLGLLGLIPFGLGAAAAWAPYFLLPPSLAYDFGETTLLYAGLIAAYIAGTGAGGLLTGGPRRGEGLLPGMIAVLVAWVAIWPVGAFSLALNDILRYLIVILVLVFLLLRDLRAVADGALPHWYGPLRKRLTFWASISLALIMCRALV